MKLRVSSSIAPFREKAEEIWGVERYKFPQDIFQPTVFFGLYHSFDWLRFILHRGKRYVLWGGGDLVNVRKQYAFNDGKALWLSILTSWIPWGWIFQIFKAEHFVQSGAEHFVENDIEQRGLSFLGIKSKVRPSFLGDISKYPVSFKSSKKPHVFSTGWDKQEGEYGLSYIVDRLAAKVPEVTFHIYGVNWKWMIKNPNVVMHGRVPSSQFDKEIKKYQGALRLNKHDGFAETIAKSILIGQYPISRIKYPMIDSYKTEEELIKLLKGLKNKKKPNYKAREFWQKNVNNFPWAKKTS